MARPLRVDLYCEDLGHELFVRALLLRLAREERRRISILTRSGRGGHGAAMAEFRAWQRLSAGMGDDGPPDLLALIIDSNCQDWNGIRRELEDSIDSAVFSRAVVGCPDPHVERWCLADPKAFQDVVGAAPPEDPGKCERLLYKRLLRETITTTGQPILTDPMEWAPDIVRAMDLYRAGKNQRSLGHFLDHLRAALRVLAPPAD